MNDPNNILFEQAFYGMPLFKSQQELVNLFLQLRQSPYYVDPGNLSEYNKVQSRLKAFLSQLLSGSVTRTVTENFKTALSLAVHKKLPLAEEADQVVMRIIELLTAKHTPAARNEKGSVLKTGFMQEATAANYLCFITAKPMDVEYVGIGGESNMRTFFVNDLISTLTTDSYNPKYYRFNFPLESYCEILWNGLERILIHKMDDLVDDTAFIHSLNDRFIMSSYILTTYNEYIKSKEETSSGNENLEIRETLISSLVVEILERLNRRKILLTFHVPEPIYTVPLVAINPNESNGKLYFLIDDDNKSQSIVRTSSETNLLWRIFVWDKLKANNISNNIPFRTLRNNSK